jgi:hypothetical protein
VKDLQGLVVAGVDTFVCLQRQYKEHGCNDYQLILRKLSRQNRGSFPPRELRFLHCPMPDLGVASDECLRALVAELQRELSIGHGLYVHCFGGHGRTGTVIVNLIMATEGVDFATAMAKLKQCHQGRRSKRGRQCCSCPLSKGKLEDKSQKEQAIRMQVYHTAK